MEKTTFDDVELKILDIDDEAISKFFKDNSACYTGLDVSHIINEIVGMINQLKEEYAPTIEMTSVQRDTLLEDDPDSLIKSLREPGTDNFDEGMWNPLTERQIAIAWLHPELIEVVE